MAAVARTCRGPARDPIDRTDRNLDTGLHPGSTDGENAVVALAAATRINDRESISSLVGHPFRLDGTPD